jgi:hypothetical protein
MPSWKERWNLPFLRDIPVCGKVRSWFPESNLTLSFRAQGVIQMLKKRIQPSKLQLVVFPRLDRIKERPMRRWYVPLTMLGLGSIGAFLLSERGRNSLRAMSEDLDEAPERCLEWNESAQSELDRIQAALKRIAESLEPGTELGQ